MSSLEIFVMSLCTVVVIAYGIYFIKDAREDRE